MATMTAFTAQTLYTPATVITNPVVMVEDGTIVRLETRDGVAMPSGVDLVAFNDCTIAPGFIDIHIHGSAGYDVMQADRGAHSHFEHFLAQHGVTSYCPTTVTAPLDVTCSALERLADAVESADGSGGARPLGIHLEGPFLSHARRGVHSTEDLLPPTVAMLDKFWQAARGHIRVMTI